MGKETSCLSSGIQASSITIKSTPGEVFGVIAIGDGTNVASAEVRNGGASGTILLQARAGTNAWGATILTPYSVRYATDIYLKLTGTNAQGIVLYR